jgi:pectinesterase
MVRFLVLILLSSSALLPAAGTTTLVVDAGGGRFKTVQAAIDSIPDDNRTPVVISIRNGVYKEQVRLRKSLITFRGQDRKKTRIEWDVDTTACPVADRKEDNCASVLVNASDLRFEHLTIQNGFRGEGTKATALSISGTSTRVAIVDADITGYGGDTLVMSSRGLFYLDNVYVSGTYHIFVPRATAYVKNSRFWCIGHKTCLFNEGIIKQTDKLVIRDSVIDGPAPFGLGSYFRDAAWYFIDVKFGPNLMDQRIFKEPPAVPYEMKWGYDRVYFSGSRGPDYPWLKDNLDQSPIKDKKGINVASTLEGWNPE